MKHPNTVIGGGTSGISALILWILDQTGTNVPGWVGALIAAAVTSAFLFVGRNGIKGVWNRLVNGNPTPTP